MRKNLVVALAAACISLFTFLPSVHASVGECDYSKAYNDPRTIYVSRDGSAQFNCDGVDDDVEINAAFRALEQSAGAYTRIFLKSGTYVISQPVTIASNSAFSGDEDAVLMLKDHAGWKTISNPSSTAGVCANYFVPLIGGGMSGTTYKAVQNVEVGCFTIDGNFDGNVSASSEAQYYPSVGTKLKYNSCMTDAESKTDDRWMGLGYYTMMYFPYSSNISVHDMVLRNGFTDGLKVHAASDVRFYDNTVKRLGHEGFFASSSNGVSAQNNKVWARTNTAFRLQDVYDAEISGNYITNFGQEPSGYLAGRNYGSGPGIELDKQKTTSKMTNIDIHDNMITQTWGPGIWAASTVAPADIAVNVHHNIFYQAGLNRSIRWVGGIVANNFTGLSVQNNVFDESYAAAINTYPAVAGASTIDFRNNIVSNTHQGLGTLYSGYGIDNYNSLSTITSENNCFYNNYAGDFSGTVTSTEDVSADPLFADAASGDYHLLSTAGRFDPATGSWVNDAQDSPCIDAGSVASDYSLEPDYNGVRINIGRYGNTAEASKSQAPVPTYALSVTGGTGSGAYGAGNEVVVSADLPLAGKIFDQWTGDTAYISDIYSSSATVTMPAQAVSIAASYKDAPLPTYVLSVAGGTGSGVYLAGTMVDISAATPAQGKIFDRWTGDTSNVADIYASTTTVTMPEQGVDLTATYKDVYYSLTVNNGSGSGDYIFGQSVAIAAGTAPSGKVFDQWTGDVSYIADIHSASTTVTMPTMGIAVTASYKDAYYALNVAGGTGSGSYIMGQLVLIAANTPATGKVFDKWTGDITYVSNIYTANTLVTMPERGVNLTATYKSAYYLTVNYGNGDGYYASGAKVTIIANAPATGKIFSKWIGDTSYVSSIYSSTATVTMPAKAITLTATYKTAPKYYLTVNYGTGDGSYFSGATATLKANAPATGKVFDKWTGDTASVANIYSATTSFTMPGKATSVTATYRAR